MFLLVQNISVVSSAVYEVTHLLLVLQTKKKEITLVVIHGHYSIARLCGNPRGPWMPCGVGWGMWMGRVRDGSATQFPSPGLHITFSFRPSGKENIVPIW